MFLMFLAVDAVDDGSRTLSINFFLLLACFPNLTEVLRESGNPEGEFYKAVGLFGKERLHIS